MKIVFMGTPEFAVPSLEKLIECGCEIPMVVTQPDRRGNRGKITFSPVKECALQHGLPVAQPQQIRKDEEFMQELEALEPDFMTASTCTDPCSRNFGVRRRCSILSFRGTRPPA